MVVESTIDKDTFHQRTGVTEEDFQIVARASIFSNSTADDLRCMLIDSAVQEFSRNTLLFLQREPALRFYVILEGWVKIFRETVDGREIVLHVFGSGDSFAEASIFEANGYPASAAACVDIRVLGIPAASFRGKLSENEKLSETFMWSVSHKLRLLTRQVEQLAARSATERLAFFLSGLCVGDCLATVVRLPLEKAVIAAKLGMQPETFSRSMSKLRVVGVSIDGDMVSIPDVVALRRISEGCKVSNSGFDKWPSPDMRFSN